MSIKKELIDYLAYSAVHHIEYMLEHRTAEYLSIIGHMGLSNRDELLGAKKLLLDTIKPKEILIDVNIVQIWAQKVERDYDLYNFVPFTRIISKRLLDLYLQSEDSKEALKNELLSFKYETHQLNLTVTVSNESALREVLREVVVELDSASWGYFLEQSTMIQSTFIKYFENILEEASQELKVLNTDLEQKVQEKSKDLLDSLYTDKLTQIANLNSFLKDIQKYEKKNIVLFNIDGFKKINSVYGYSFADEVLKAATQKINKQVLTCGNYKLYRYHGDLFLILELNTSNNSIEYVYNNVLASFETENLKIANEVLNLTFTGGIAQVLDEPIKYAELAFDMAKENRSKYEIYDGDDSKLQEYKQHQHTLTIIKNAIDNDLVIPHFQLIRDNKNPDNKKYEALMRIQSPSGDVISPFIFLDIAKDAKLYNSLAKRMIKKSIQTFEHVDASFSINLEVEDVLNTTMMDYLYDLIIQYSVEKKIILEITESENIKDFREVCKIFGRFKDLGIKVAIDDFGTGYSNFSYLTEFDFDYIKIDGSLIKNIYMDKDSFIVTELIVDFAKKLGKKVIAEFIDKPEVQAVVEELGIDYSQGYLFSKPSRDLI